MGKQTYDNYFKDYFDSPGGNQALRKAKERHHAKLRQMFPGVGINKAQKMLTKQKQVSNG